MTLLEEDAEAHVKGVCFKTGPPGRVGVELEWLVHDRADSRAVVSAPRVDEVLARLQSGGLPHGGRLTREPGGQVELSSPPADSLLGAAEAASADLTVLRRAFADAGLVLTGLGLDPDRASAPRILDHPRYRAMEAYFDRFGPWGRMMMRGTASVQVNLDTGDAGDGLSGYRSRWRLAHRIGPVLVAAFANSPLWQGRPTGWLSTRQTVWAHLDPGRTSPPAELRRDPDPRSAWARYALDAHLLCVRAEPAVEPAAGEPDWTAPSGLSFRAWLRGGNGCAAGRGPTLEDLDYHLSTLFPPVRPRGWLELRMIDALPGDDWLVPLAVATALLDDPVAADAAFAATEALCTCGAPTPSRAVWEQAARVGPGDPELGKAARSLFSAAESALARLPEAARLRRAVGEFAERYPERGRCPADDQLDALRSGARARPDEGALT